MTTNADWSPVTSVQLPAIGSAPAGVHVFDDDSNLAIEAALAARRPLLVRGEPGTGKSQLARAAAAHLRSPLVACTVDGQTESRELLWTLDSVARLADAQVAGVAANRSEGRDDHVGDRRNRPESLDERRYLRPGPLWWAFDWNSAASIATEARVRVPSPPTPDGWKPSARVVVLIDEIDKADSSVPNGLLEALGAGRFAAPGMADSVAMKGEVPLVIVTTNEERALPDAFLRRCLVLRIALPDDPVELKAFLVDRGRAHFPHSGRDVLETAADLLANERFRVRDRGLSPPGQAEYLDLLRAVCAQRPDAAGQLKLLGRIAKFVLDKHPPSRDGT